MIIFLRAVIGATLVASLFSSCVDHQLGPTSLLRSRLKTVTYFSSGSISFSREFTYNASNRLVSCANSNGITTTYEYDEQNRFSRFVITPFGFPLRGEVAQFAYSNSTNDFQLFIGTRPKRDYMVDANKRIVQYTSSPSGFNQDESYTYSGDNVTAIKYTQGPVVDQISYEYDTHPNPFYGLIGDNIHSEETLSRNNVTKRASGSFVILEYAYEYNSQGLPIKRKSPNGIVGAVYTYETY